mmetsp:Transcript_5701/g.7667  ORF Transcript_5701/g.7667 Transcript_5701/m.7667 type:complete len:170 (-) Transcript_5701:759-1268(-)
MELNLELLKTREQLAIALLLRALAKVTLFDALKINALAFLFELVDHFVAKGLVRRFLFFDLFSLLLFLLLGGLAVSCLIKRFLDLLDPCEWEVVLDLVLQNRDVILHVEQREIRRRIDLLEVDLLAEQGIFWLFPDLLAERHIGALDDITPEAAHQDVVSRLFGLSWHE